MTVRGIPSLQNKRLSGQAVSQRLIECHNVDGCIDLMDNPSTLEELQTTSSRKQESSTTHVATTEAVPLTSVLIKSFPKKEEGLGLINTEVFIYAVCGVSTFLILIFTIVCLCVHRKSKKANVNGLSENQIRGNNRQDDEDVDLEISHNISTEKGTGHEYEEIDEHKMSEFFIISSLEQASLSDNDNSSESSDGIRLPNDGYLNPYTPLLSTKQQTEDSHGESDEHNRSSKVNILYTNLYQSLKLNRDDKIRLYTRCHSVQYLELVDEPIEKKNETIIRENGKRHVQTL
ncbi:uncharacterized protein LOC134697929 [Mytilus trossulus]|uniref:uncharacterized protein LOC134697929 n=1 Tax=Mytilus trossulus TaxID=6551 RepID=UPI003004404C